MIYVLRHGITAAHAVLMGQKYPQRLPAVEPIPTILFFAPLAPVDMKLVVKNIFRLLELKPGYFAQQASSLSAVSSAN